MQLDLTQPRGLLVAFALGLGSAALTPACVAGGAADDCAPGSEACVCVQGLCIAGLTCVSGYCVNLGTTTGGPGTTGGGPGTDTDTGTEDSDTDDPTGGNEDWNPCLALIECVKQAEPAAISAITSAYGSEGTCYDIPDLSPEDCWAECEALRQAYAGNSIPECAPFACDDGVLDAHEMCDPIEPGVCGVHCEFLNQHDCNPLTQPACSADPFDRCLVSTRTFLGLPPSNDVDKHIFECEQTLNGDRGMHEDCWNGSCSYDYPACGLGFAMPQCNFTRCCTQYCALGETTLDASCPAGYTCQPLDGVFSMSLEWVEGVENIGVCL